MKIIINENQVKLINEDLSSLRDVSYEMKESIALWCLMNDFRYSFPDKSPSIANSEQINKEICKDIMNGNVILSNEEKEIFGYNDYDNFEDGDDEREEFMNGYNVYKIQTDKNEYYIETSNTIHEYDGSEILQDFEDGSIDEYDSNYDLIGWFYRLYR